MASVRARICVALLLALFAVSSFSVSIEVEDFLMRLVMDKDSIKNGEFSYWRLLKKTTEKDAILANDTDSVTVFLQANMLARPPFILRGEKPVKFRVNETIYPVRQILKKLRPGDNIQMWVPVEWAYGAKGYGVAQGDGLIVFNIELVRVNSVRGNDPDYNQPPFLRGIVEYRKKLKDLLDGLTKEEPKQLEDEEESYRISL